MGQVPETERKTYWDRLSFKRGVSALKTLYSFAYILCNKTGDYLHKMDENLKQSKLPECIDEVRHFPLGVNLDNHEFIASLERTTRVVSDLATEVIRIKYELIA